MSGHNDERSELDASAEMHGGNIAINADLSPGLELRGPAQDVRATGQTGASGSITNNPANNNATNGLAHLSSTLHNENLDLQPRCGEGTDFSSFLISGNGGIAPEPDFWLSFPELNFLTQPPDIGAKP